MAMQHMYSCFLWCKKECPSPFGFKLSRVAFRQIPAYANIGMGVHVMEWRIYIYIYRTHAGPKEEGRKMITLVVPSRHPPRPLSGDGTGETKATRIHISVESKSI